MARALAFYALLQNEKPRTFLYWLLATCALLHTALAVKDTYITLKGQFNP